MITRVQSISFEIKWWNRMRSAQKMRDGFYRALEEAVEKFQRNAAANRTEGEMPNIGCSLQMRFFRYGDGQRYYAGRTLANFGIDKR